MAMTDASSLFVDMNILIYATDPRSPFQPLAVEALRQRRSEGTLLVASPQVLREYMAVASRPATVGGGIPINDILDNIETFRRVFQIVEDNSAVIDQLLLLLRRIPTANRRIHDTNIVATMVAHDVRRLFTHNTRDFTPYAAIIDIVPLMQPATE